MKFWRWIAWICTVGFLLMLVFARLMHGQPEVPSPSQLNEPPPAPLFR